MFRNHIFALILSSLCVTTALAQRQKDQGKDNAKASLIANSDNQQLFTANDGREILACYPNERRSLPDCIVSCAENNAKIPSMEQFSLFAKTFIRAFEEESKDRWFDHCIANPGTAATSKFEYFVRGSEGFNSYVRSYNYFCAEDELYVHEYAEPPQDESSFAIFRGMTTDTLLQSTFKESQCFCIGIPASTN